MKSHAMQTRAALRLMLALVGMVSIAGHPASADPVVIVNLKNHEALSSTVIKQIFLRRLEAFPSGAAVVPVESNESRKEFSDKFLKMTPESLNAYWARLLFTGESKPLKVFASDDDVINFVRDNQFAIGYIDSAKAVSSVRVLQQ